MLVGYNNNITYKGKVYHAQTEDCGLNNPIIVTLLYFKGTILASKKTSYSHLIGSSDIREKVREMMKEQHKAMLKELIAGKFTGGVTEGEEASAVLHQEEKPVIKSVPAYPKHRGHEEKKPASKTLDEILLDYIEKGER